MWDAPNMAETPVRLPSLSGMEATVTELLEGGERFGLELIDKRLNDPGGACEWAAFPPISAKRCHAQQLPAFLCSPVTSAIGFRVRPVE